MPHISIVVPVYKAEDCLLELYRRIRESVECISNDFELILVEDFGGDKSWEIIEHLSKIDSRVVGVQFSRNFGQHYGITAGLDFCNGDWVVVMDCDLQDRPEEIPRLYKRANEGFDVVLARRGKRKDHLFKRITSWGFYKVFSYLADIEYDGEVGNFRIVSREVVRNFRQMRENLRFFGALVQWMGFSTCSIDVEHDKRFSGESTYTLQKLWALSVEIIIAYSDKPLRLAIRFGFLMATFAFCYGIGIFIYSIINKSSVAGWNSLIVSLYFIGGIIIFILGILGIYLGKTFDQTKARPLYIVRKKTGNFESIN